MLGIAIALFSRRFGEHAVAAAGVSAISVRQRRWRLGFRRRSVSRVLRQKEWALLRRDPWLVSQTLMQILYLLPPAVLLWVTFRGGNDAFVVLIPVVVMAAGQLAGGLAWLAISGEDAPDLVATAPITAAPRLMGKDRSRHRRHRADVCTHGCRAGARFAIRSFGLRPLRPVRGRGRNDDSALLPRAGQAQSVPPPADFVAHRNLCRSLLIHRLGRNLGAGRGRHLVRAVSSPHRDRHSRRRENYQPEAGVASS